MAVTKTKKGFPSVVVSPTYGAYAGVSKTATEIHFCKEEKKIIVDGVLYASEKSCMCGSDTASTGGWYKLGRLECNSDNQVNVNVICSIMETYNSAYSGLFVLQARHDKAGSWSIKKLQWLARIGFSATAVKCVIDGHKAYLYAYKTTTQYSRLFIKVLCESGWNNRTPYLFLADNSTPETSTPGGTTIAECCAPTATTATLATTAKKVENSLNFKFGDTDAFSYKGDAALSITIPNDMIQTASNGGFTFKRASKTFCATVSSVVSATPFWKIKLTSYSDNFNGYAPQNGDTLFLWVKNAVASSTTAYPFCIPYGTAGESDNSKCIPLYHGQNTGTPKEWLGSTALSAGFYMFVFRSDVRGTSTAITTNGGWVFLYRNVSTT